MIELGGAAPVVTMKERGRWMCFFLFGLERKRERESIFLFLDRLRVKRIIIMIQFVDLCFLLSGDRKRRRRRKGEGKAAGEKERSRGRGREKARSGKEREAFHPLCFVAFVASRLSRVLLLERPEGSSSGRKKGNQERKSRGLSGSRSKRTGRGRASKKKKAA